MDLEGVLKILQLLTTYADTTSTPYTDIVPDEEDIQSNIDTVELICLNPKFGHCSFWKITKISKQGVLPERLLKVNIPV